MTPLLGFTPDADPLTPGVMLDCVNIVPHEYGMKAASSPQATSIAQLPNECQGAAIVRKLDGTRRFIAGTAAGLYETTGTTWTNVSKASGYAGGVESRWSIAQFGDSTIAANGVDPIQKSISGAFASISGAPVAKIVFSVGAFVMALNVNDGAVKQDGWANCASFNDADWAPNVSTLANSGRLVSAPGAITAGGRLGEFAIAYKEWAIYVGQFVGAPATFDWVQVPGVAGCVGQDAWCDVLGAHFVVGPDDFWLFDGTRPAPIGTGQVRQWFFNNSNPLYRYKTKCIFDEQNHLVYVYFAGKSSAVNNSALVYHLISKQWGFINLSIQAAINFVQPAITIDGLGSLSATIDGLPNIPFDSQYWLGGGRLPGVFDSAGNVVTLSGPALNSSFTTGELGDDDQVTTLTKIRIRFQQSPTSAVVTGMQKMNEGDPFVNGQPVALTNGQFDVRQTGRFHAALFELNGDCRFNAIRPTIVPSGER